jgi:endogenous inhibitor of DNA gyrase (YacG/DUF329 family)
VLHLNTKTVSCPTCKRPAEFSAANPDRPFCSERCRLIDLGEWFAEKHAIPADNPPDHDPESGP